jgi:dUTP pyrophosphatase
MRAGRLLRVKRLVPFAILPTPAHGGDSGLDLHAAEEALIGPGGVRTLGTGIAICLPRDTEGQIRPRSGLAHQHGVTVLNSPGTIDEGYRGELRVILINHGKKAFRVRKGMKIAQLVVQDRVTVRVVERDSLPRSTRGSAGLGSTGK